VGYADSGDFAKITRLFDFDVDAPDNDDRWFKYVFLRYRFNPEWHWYSELPSSEMLLVAPAVALNRLISPAGFFDLRCMGAVHAALALLALGLLLPLFRVATRWRRAAISAAALVIFCDVVYVCYFNSFYMDTAALVFLWLTAVFMARLACAKRASLWDRAGFLISCLLFLTAKAQHSLAGLPIALLIGLRPELVAPSRPKLGRFAIAPLIAALAVWWTVLPPADYSAAARYNVIFFWILPHSPDASRDLRALGLDDSYRPHIGTYSYSPNSRMTEPAFIREFRTKTSHTRLALFYLRHPSHAVRMLRLALEDAAFQRGFNGNYPKEAGKAPAAQSYAFSLWSSLKQRVFSYHPWRYGVYVVALCVLAPLIWVRERSVLMECALAVSATAMLMLGIGGLADGADFARHLYLFNACLDLLLFVVLVRLVGGLRGRVRRTQETAAFPARY